MISRRTLRERRWVIPFAGLVAAACGAVGDSRSLAALGSAREGFECAPARPSDGGTHDDPATDGAFHFPHPSGPYGIGTLIYHWVDSARQELFSSDPRHGAS